MLKIFYILGLQILFIFPSFALDRKELLQLCSSQARNVILNDSILTVKPSVNYLGMTSWLSDVVENESGPTWTFAHGVRIQKTNGQHMNWDFISVAQPTTDSCNLISVKKERETNILPPCEGPDCDSDDISDFINLLLPVAANADQCFYKHEGISKIPGAHLLPEKICLSKVEVQQEANNLHLNIQGAPITGTFPLSFLIEDEKITKYMTYIFSKDYVENNTQITATIRVSVDILKNSTRIDYAYLAAEFFVFHKDGSYDAHIYYYKRKPLL